MARPRLRRHNGGFAKTKVLRLRKMICVHCGKAFQARRSTARFCSIACRMAAHRISVTARAEQQVSVTPEAKRQVSVTAQAEELIELVYDVTGKVVRCRKFVAPAVNPDWPLYFTNGMREAPRAA
jgi:hypothetical protein